MSRTKSLFAAALGCLGLLAGSAFADAPSAVSDSQITDRVLGKLSVDDPAIAKRVQVATKDGVVTLTGRANTGNEAAKALRDAGSVAGVIKVENHLQLQQ